MLHPLIIGQAPARGNDDKPPFSGQSGSRLAKLAGVGETGDVLPQYFQLINLLDFYPGKAEKGRGDIFSKFQAEAKARANEILSLLFQPDRDSRIILLMGVKVSEYMGFGDLPMLGGRYVGGHHFIKFPHPSGTSAYWNNKTNVLIAGWILRGALHHGRTR